MISQKIINKILGVFKNPVKKIIDYDKENYVVEVDFGKDGTELYGVDKKTYEILNFSIGADIEGYFKALNTRTVYSK